MVHSFFLSFSSDLQIEVMAIERKMRSPCSPTLPELLSYIVLSWTCLSATTAAGLWLTLPESGSKCVSEEIQSNVVVLADYAVVYDDQRREGPTVSAKVTSPYGNNLHRQKNVTAGRFAFATTEPGNYLACFWVEDHHTNKATSVSLEWRIGIGARDWDSIARKEKIQGVELELRKLEGAVEAIHENLLYLRDREAEMRTVSEITNSRVAWFSMMSLSICILVSAVQVWHLKGYFQKKKLI